MMDTGQCNIYLEYSLREAHILEQRDSFKVALNELKVSLPDIFLFLTFSFFFNILFVLGLVGSLTFCNY